MISDASLLRILRSNYAVRLLGDAIRALCAVAMGLVIVALIIYNGVFFIWMKDKLNYNDFGRFYYSARAYLEHRDMYGSSPATLIDLTPNLRAELWNMNPPHFELSLVPVAVLPPFAAYLVWLAISAMSCAASIRLIMAECGGRLSMPVVFLGTIALLASAPFATQIITGQVAWLMLWPLTAAWVATRRSRWTRAAVLWGACISVKPFLAIVVPYFLIRRQWRGAVTILATIALVFMAGFLVVGADEYRSWAEAVSQSETWAWLTMNASLYALSTRALQSGPQLHAVVEAPALVRPLWAFSSAAVMTAAFWALMVPRRDVDRDILVLLLVSMLVSPLGWLYYVWWLCGPAVALYATRRHTPSLARLGLGCLLWPFFATNAGQPHWWATLTVGSVYVWSLLLLFASAIFDAQSGATHVFIATSS